jgi:transposase
LPCALAAGAARGRADSPAEILVSWSRAAPLNPALHTIVLARLRDDPQTRADAARRRSEGTSAREGRRCLKRVVARQLFKLLER